MLASAFEAFSKNGTYYISGIVRDSVTLEPLSFATVSVPEAVVGTLTNEKGLFDLTVPNNTAHIVVSCLGYKDVEMDINKNHVNVYNIMMSPSTTELKELEVKRKKYSKKNNPAVEFAERLKRDSKLTDPKRNPFYNYKKQEVISIGLNDFVEKNESSWLFKKFPFLWEHVDTSEISGKPYLNAMTKETISEVNYRKNPQSQKETVIAQRQDGIDEIVNQEGTLTYLQEMMREIDLFGNDIYIAGNKFVSPLSRIATDFYKFYLTDTVEVDGEKCIVLSFYPFNTASFGFNGQVYVPANDSTMFIKKVTMKIPRNINLNFIDNLYISQNFDKAPDGSRLKKNDDLIVELKLMNGTPGLYARRNLAFDNHNFEKLDDETVFNKLEDKIQLQEPVYYDNDYWESIRIVDISDSDKRTSDLMTKLRSVPIYYWFEKIIYYFVNGYIPTGKNSKFDFGPLNTTVSHNAVEGWRVRLGGMTTANLNKRIFGRGYLAYGFDDRKVKYCAELEYSFNDKKYHSREFPIHSIRATSLYDLDQVGQNYLYTNQDNIFLSFARMKSKTTTYHNVNKLAYILELGNNLSFQTTIKNELQHATPYLNFVDGYGKVYNEFSQTSLDLMLRFAPGEKFYQNKSSRSLISRDAPVFSIAHTIAPKKMLGNSFNINVTEASFQKRFWFSAFGYADVTLRGGHIWSKSPYPYLLIPTANLSYTIQRESFSLMNSMEFVNDTYGSWFITYFANGFLMNSIPGIKKLRLREVISFRGIMGHLSRRNNPDFQPELFRFPEDVKPTPMTLKPYMEIAAGFDNILSCLRLEYVWRLTYLDVPYKIDRSGLRVGFHVKF